MESQDEVVINNGNIGGQSIVKGKRTKRLRPQSPIPFRMITPNSSKSDEGSDICSNNNVVDNNVMTATTTTTTMLSEDEEDAHYLGTTTTTNSVNEEEEEMANCLILLAQGQARDIEPVKPQKITRTLSFLDNDNHNVRNASTSTKFTSRKFMEAPTTAGKSGYYVYECKTCSKTFPSFQALGGHRASHKKPKNNKDEDHGIIKSRSSNNNVLSIVATNNNNINRNYNTNYTNLVLSSDEEDPPFKSFRRNASSSSLSLQLTNRALYQGNSHGNPSNKARVHGCSICGAEFSSGQALGGHMRRHRGPVNGAAVAATPISAVVPTSIDEGSLIADQHQMEDMLAHMNTPLGRVNNINNNNISSNNYDNNASMLSLDLDLNLPAPTEDVADSQQREGGNKFVLESKQPQDDQQRPPSPPPPPPPPPPQNHPPLSQQLVFSSPALVDCHY